MRRIILYGELEYVKNIENLTITRGIEVTLAWYFVGGIGRESKLGNQK